MKKISRILIGLAIFLAVEVLIIGAMFVTLKIDFESEYRSGAEANFTRVIQAVKEIIDAGEEVEESEFDLSDLYIYSFENVLIVERDGYITSAARQSTYKTGGSFRPSGVDFTRLFNSALQVSEATISGANSLLLAANAGDYVIIAYVGLGSTAALIDHLVQRMIIVGSAQGGLLLILMLIVLSDNKKRTIVEDSIARAYPSSALTAGRHYVFEMAANGNLIKSTKNSFFEKFEIESIVDYYVDTGVTISKALSDRVPFSLLINDKEGAPNFYNCLATRISSGYRVLAIDGTKQYLENKKISEQIFLEPITGLKNRSSLEFDLDQCIQQSDRKQQRSIAVFNIRNLDNLETLHSRSVRDKMLKSCADMFRERYKGIDGLYFFGGNKFAILTTNSEDTNEVKQSINEFNNNLNAIVRIDRNNVQIITDVIFLYLDNLSGDIKLDEIVEYNEYLVLNVKGRVNANVISEIFTKSKYYHAIGNKKELTKKIIDTDNFYLYFQPQIRLSDNKLAAFESLVRLNEISMTTQDFILISEVNGYMLQLGDKITEKAFEFAQKIKKSGIPLSINLSPIQLLSKGFVDKFLKSYNKFGLEPGSIALEITETFLMSDVTENIKKLQILHDNHIHIHLDDFGMGYSSLAYLKNIPIDAIKIDMEFVKAIDVDSYSKAISKFVVTTAKQIGKETIAEGVEKQSQLDCLKSIGCDIVQGFLTGKPMSEENAIAFIQSNMGVQI